MTRPWVGTWAFTASAGSQRNSQSSARSTRSCTLSPWAAERSHRPCRRWAGRRIHDQHRVQPRQKGLVRRVGVYVSGREEKHFVRNMALEVRRASTKLSKATGLDVHAMGLIVFVDPVGHGSKGPAGDGALDIRVISDSELIATIGDRPFSRRPRLPDSLKRRSGRRPGTTLPTESHNRCAHRRGVQALESAVGPLRKSKPNQIQGQRSKQPTASPHSDQAVKSSRASRVRAANKSPKRGPPSPEREIGLRRFVGLAIVLGLAYFMTRPDGQAFLTAVFGG